MALAPDFDEDELGASMVDYWPSRFGERRLEEPSDEPPKLRPLFVRRERPSTPEEERYARRVRHAYNAWVAAGHLPVDGRSSMAVMAHWKAYRERYLALEVVEGEAP